jgi:hypothetical protein
LIIDGPGALDGDLDIIVDVFLGRPPIRSRLRATVVLAALLFLAIAA